MAQDRRQLQQAAHALQGTASADPRLRPNLDRGTTDPALARQDLVDLALERVAAVEAAQLAELAASSQDAIDAFRRELADSHKTAFTLPDPSRWHEAAELYREAVEALCRGDLVMGGNLLSEAMAAEEETREAASRLVRLDAITGPGRPPGSVPAGACPRCAPPAALQVVDRILARGPAAEMPGVRPLWPKAPVEEAEEDSTEDED